MSEGKAPAASRVMVCGTGQDKDRNGSPECREQGQSREGAAALPRKAWLSSHHEVREGKCCFGPDGLKGLLYPALTTSFFQL